MPHLGRKQVTRSRSGGNVRSKVACESVAESFVEGDKAEIQIDGPDEVLSARNQEARCAVAKVCGWFSCDLSRDARSFTILATLRTQDRGREAFISQQTGTSWRGPKI